MERSARMGPLRSRRLTTSPWVPDGAPRTVAPPGRHEPHDASELGRNPAPLGGRTTGLSVSAGMNDSLIPREQFLDSPFGEAMFLGRNTSYNASNGAPPLVGSSETNYLTPFGGTNLMIDLGAYWQNRAIAPGSEGNLTGSTESGTSEYLNGDPNTPNTLEVQVMAAPSVSSNNTGGLPSNPALYATVGDTSALQSIVTLNITNTTGLDLLLAGLMDNTTGGPYGVNGTFQSVTTEVGSLGLSVVVVGAIPNAVVASEGLYGPPSNNYHPPTGGFWGTFWNAVSAVVTNPLGTVLSLVDTVWNAGTAAFTYLNHLAHEAVAIGAEIVARTAATIVHVGQLIESALSTLLSFIWTEISSLFTRAIQGLTSAFNSGLRNWMSLLYSAGNHTVLAYEGVDAPANTAAAAELIGQALVVPLALAIAAGVAIDVLLGVTIPFDIGPSTVASFLIPIVIGLLASKLQGAGGSGWPGMILSFMEGGVESTIMGISSAAEWLFNRTQNMSSSAASDTIAPNFSPPGDAWALSAAIVGGSGTGSGLRIFSLLDDALPAVITPEAPAPQQATAAADAGAAVVYAIIGLSLVLIEYVVSLIAPQSGPLAAVAFVAEMIMGIFGAVFASVAALCALEGQRDPAVRTITGALGWVGVGLSLGATGAGLYDVYNLGTHPP